MDGNSGPEGWYRNLPLLTKCMLTGTFVITLCITVDILEAPYIYLLWYDVYKRYQVWRLVTNYLYVGKFSIGWILHMYLFTQFASKLEKNEIFSDSPGGFLAFLFYQMMALAFLSLLIFYPSGVPLLGSSLLFAIIYYWSRRESWSYINIWGFTVQGYQLPFVLMLLNLLMGNSLWFDILGLLTGHAYYFLREILPSEGGPDIFGRTPHIFDNIILFCTKGLSSPLAASGGGSVRTPHANNRDAQSRPSAEFMGRGYRLGGEG